MNRTVLGLLFAVSSAAHLSSQMGNMNAPTFTKDVVPILQKNCQSCHRPGGAGPFSLMTHQLAERWGEDIKSFVKSKQMPPWQATSGVAFDGELRMSDKDIETLVRWVDLGSPEGNA